MSSRIVWVVNYESSRYVENLLSEDFLEQVDQVVVLDNGSSSGDYEALMKLACRFAKVQLLRSEDNKGFGAGHNAISRMTCGHPDDLIWILNPDVTVAPGVVAELAHAIEIGYAEIVSPVILTVRDGAERVWFSGGRIDARKGIAEDSQLGANPKAVHAAPKLISTQFVSGAAPMLRRATWDRLGGFDERLFLYWEDVDLCLRASSLGFRLMVCSRAVITHAEGGSTKGVAGRRSAVYYYSSRNRILVCRDKGERGFRYVFGAGAPAFARLLAHGLLREGPGGWGRVRAAVKGARDGVRNREEFGIEAVPLL